MRVKLSFLFALLTAGLSVSAQPGSAPPTGFPTNGLWLEITNVADGLAYLNLHNATDTVYEVWTKNDLSETNWDINQELWPTNQSVMPFTIDLQGQATLFVWARDWTGIDENSNGIPDWWEWKYFGTLSLPADTNYDNGPGSILYDYQNNIDPNVIQFTPQFASTYVSSNMVQGALIVLAGHPSYVATQINSTNHSQATWQPSSSNFTVCLPTNGYYDVWVGARGLPSDAQQTWIDTWLSVYQVPLTLALNAPSNNVVSLPVFQLQGQANEPLSSITFDLTNAAGAISNQAALATSSYFDTNVSGITTNQFQCNVNLAAGANTITVHATDFSSNQVSASTSITLDYASRTNPPTLTILWPTNNGQISGGSFTLQAQVDDPTATVSAFINGSSNSLLGTIEPSGQVWVQGIPLLSGTNSLVVTVQTLGGFESTTNMAVVQSPVDLTIDPLPTNELNQPVVTVTGTVDDSGYNVWVNGVEATVTGSTWEADGVPVSAGGTAGMIAQAGTDAAHIIASQTLYQLQPAAVVLKSYYEALHTYYYSYTGGGWFAGDISYGNTDVQWQWSYNTGGYEAYNECGLNSDGDHILPSTQIYTVPPSQNGVAPGAINPVWIWGNNISMLDISTNGGYDLLAGVATENTRVMILPSGQQQAGTTSLYLVTASAAEYSTPAGWPGLRYWGWGGDTPLPACWMTIQGQGLVDFTTNSDGSIWGEAYIAAPAGEPLDVTPTINEFYTNDCGSFQVQAYQCQLVSTCFASIPADDARTNIGVGEQVTLAGNYPLPASTQWSTTGGSLKNVSGISTTLTAPGNATNVTVTASVGNAMLTMDFDVLEPTTETSVTNDIDTYPAGTQGVGMSLIITVGPTNVSFYNVEVLEVPGPATNISGYFTNVDPEVLMHAPGTNWVPLTQGNTFPDHAAFWGWGQPWSPGEFDWSIPVQWKVNGYPNVTNSLPNNELQQHIIDRSDGTSTEKKLGSQTTRTP